MSNHDTEISKAQTVKQKKRPHPWSVIATTLRMTSLAYIAYHKQQIQKTKNKLNIQTSRIFFSFLKNNQNFKGREIRSENFPKFSHKHNPNHHPFSQAALTSAVLAPSHTAWPLRHFFSPGVNHLSQEKVQHMSQSQHRCLTMRWTLHLQGIAFLLSCRGKTPSFTQFLGVAYCWGLLHVLERHLIFKFVLIAERQDGRNEKKKQLQTDNHTPKAHEELYRGHSATTRASSPPSCSRYKLTLPYAVDPQEILQFKNIKIMF